MKNILLIDYGASRVKSITFSLEQNKMQGCEFYSKGSSYYGNKVKNTFFSNTLIKHLKEANKKFDITGVIICSEMHGFCYKYKNFLSDYFSWRFNFSDTSNLIKIIKNKAWFKDLNIYPRGGLPIVSLFSMGNKKLLKNNTEILFLPQVICNNLGKHYAKVHPTLGQSSGLYLKNQDICKILKTEIKLPEYTSDDFPLIGEVSFKNKTLPVWGGYGDLQTALYNIKANTWNINLGTGSQVASISNKTLRGFESRAFFNNQVIQCITHLPAGRSLNLIANLLKDIREDEDNSYFWNKAKSLNFKKSFIKNHKMDIDLNFFEQNRYFNSGGYIKGIKQDNFKINDIITSIILAMMKNFTDIILKSSSVHKKAPIYIYGHLANQIPSIKNIIKFNTNRHVIVKKYLISPTLINMKTILLKNLSKIN
jgi:hypothetical protein